MVLPRKSGSFPIAVQSGECAAAHETADGPVLVDHQLVLGKDTEDEQFVKLVEAFQNMYQPLSKRELVTAHPLFPTVVEEYMKLQKELILPGRGGQDVTFAMRQTCAIPYHDSEDEQPW